MLTVPRTVTNTTAGDAFLIIGDKDGRGASKACAAGAAPAGRAAEMAEVAARRAATDTERRKARDLIDKGTRAHIGGTRGWQACNCKLKRSGPRADADASTPARPLTAKSVRPRRPRCGEAGPAAASECELPARRSRTWLRRLPLPPCRAN